MRLFFAAAERDGRIQAGAPTAVLVDCIGQHRGRFGVEPICAVLKDASVQIAPSAYHAAKIRPVSAHAVRDAELVVDIKTVHKANPGVYSARKLHAELGRDGVRVARCMVERLMRAECLRGIPREKTRKTTRGDGAETERPEDKVDRKFIATAPSQLWVADLAYVRTHAGWSNVSFAFDFFSRMIVGLQVSTSLRTNLALDTIDMGLWVRSVEAGSLNFRAAACIDEPVPACVSAMMTSLADHRRRVGPVTPKSGQPPSV